MNHGRGTNLKLGQDMALLHTCAVDAGDAEDHVDGGAGLHEGPALEVVAVLLLAGVVAGPHRSDHVAVRVLRRLLRLEVFDGRWQRHRQHGVEQAQNTEMDNNGDLMGGLGLGGGGGGDIGYRHGCKKRPSV